MGYPVLYTQKRVGLFNKEFSIFKFRSMLHKTEKNNSDFERITWFGRILRVTRVDEFPQLFNILLGDMSFVGPRPLLPDYLPYYTNVELYRHHVRPGLTGLSQVEGSYPSWEEQFKYDIYYVENISFKLDLIILLKTIKKVLSPTYKLISGKEYRQRFDIYRKTNHHK